MTHPKSHSSAVPQNQASTPAQWLPGPRSSSQCCAAPPGPGTVPVPSDLPAFARVLLLAGHSPPHPWFVHIVLISSSVSLFREAFPTSPVLYSQTPSYSGMLQEDIRSRICKGLEGQLVFLRRFTRPLLLFWIPPLHPRAEAPEVSLLAPHLAGRCVAGYWRRRAVWGLHWEALTIISGGATTSLTTKFPSGLFQHVTPWRRGPL